MKNEIKKTTEEVVKIMKDTETSLEESVKSFRLNCLQLFLTYPKMDKSKEEVLFALREKRLKIKDYIVARELHKDGSPHLHVYLRLASKINYKDPHALDIFGQHGSYESVKSTKGTWQYITKGGDFITNLNVLDNQIFELKEYLLKLVHKGSIEQAKEVLKNSADPRVLGNFGKWLNDLETLYKLKYPSKVSIVYKKEQFEYPEELLDWYTLKKNLTLLLIGPSGFGKTQGALALMDKLNPLLVRDINDLKNWNTENKAIIFDDLNISKLELNELKHLFDAEMPTTHRVLYGTVKIDKGVRKLFICNTFPYTSGGADVQAILRRAHLINLKKSLIKNVTITQTTQTIVTKLELN